MEKIKLLCESDESSRLDLFISQNHELSRSAATALIEKGAVTLNGKSANKKQKVKFGDIVEIVIPDPEYAQITPEDIPLDIVYEDEHLLVVNKPKGMVVHPAPGNYSGTLVNALMYHCKDNLSAINGVMRPGIVHRIDKNTSGLLMVAKSDAAHNGLAKQIKDHSFLREYEAVVHYPLRADSGKIDAPIGRHPIKRKQMAVTQKNSKEAVTYYTVLNRTDKFSHMRLKLETGRTHQIRVHMAYIGHPVAGDDVYGPKNVAQGLDGQCLHAKKLGFVHPITNELLEFETELPDYFKQFLKKAGLKNENI